MLFLFFYNQSIEIKDNKYNLKDISKILKYDYKRISITEEIIYYSKKELLNFLKPFNNKKLKKCILNHNLENNILDLFDFIKENNFIPTLWFSQFWIPLLEQENIIITNKILDLIFDFSRNYSKTNNIAKYNVKNSNLKAMLNRKKIIFKIVFYNDLDLEKYKFYKELLEYDISLSKYKINKKTWILLPVKDFKIFIMKMNTEFSKNIREYYIKNEKKFYKHSKY